MVLHALQSSSDVNVLSTPHILTTDNEDAEITVGQNVPFQAGFSPAALGGPRRRGSAGRRAAGVRARGPRRPGLALRADHRQNVELKLR